MLSNSVVTKKKITNCSTSTVISNDPRYTCDKAIDGSAASREYVYRESVQKPTTPAYRACLEAHVQHGSLSAAPNMASSSAAGALSIATNRWR